MQGLKNQAAFAERKQEEESQGADTRLPSRRGFLRNQLKQTKL